MSIERRNGKVVIECDVVNCQAEVEGDDFESAWRGREGRWLAREEDRPRLGAGLPETREGHLMGLILDDTGKPVKGFDVIYPPGSQAWEYAPLATNPYKGCGHGCAYCYVPLATHQKRAEFDAGAVPRPGYWGRLADDCRRYEAAGVREQVLLCFSTDPYHPGDTSLTRGTLLTLSQFGLAFCTLTKGGERSIRDCDLFRPDRDAYAATLTSLDDAFSLKWERNAALPRERIDTLATFRSRGIFTWVSIEPTLDAEHSLAVIRETASFVDLFKIGKANYLGEFGKRIDWRDYTLRVIDLCQRLGVKHYVKRDLQQFLPEGYHNPLRIPQHH
jgi:DNA repair photolyase